MSKTLKIGIIGAGRIAKVHASNLISSIPGAKIAVVADPFLTPEARVFFENLGITNLVKDPETIFADASVDAVLICSSTDTHADLVVRAARAGKHVFCEKPVDLTVVKVHEALQAVRLSGVRLQVGFNRRFDHNFRAVREKVLSGIVGEPQIIKITSRDPAPPSPQYVAVSGGIFLDMMIHDFDMARFQAGSEVVEVFAAGAVLIDPAIGKAGDIDTAVVTLKFASGAIGVIDNSRKAAYGYDQRLEVFGSKGAVLAENDAPSTVRVATENGITADKPLYFFLERYKEAFIAELTEFVQAILEGRDVPVTGEDGLKNLLVALAAKKSLDEGRPVKLSELE